MAIKQSVKQECFNDAVPLPTYVDAKALGAGSAETVAVPADADFVVLTANAACTDVWINRNGSAAVASDTADGTASFCIPQTAMPFRFRIDRGASFSVLAVAAGVVTLAYYRRT